MSKLTDEQYAEYYRLLAAWVQADKLLKGTAQPDAEMEERVRRAYADLQLFRSRHGLDAPVEPHPAVYKG